MLTKRNNETMKKEDYMKLSKERLAELLEERDNQQNIQPAYVPTIIQTNPYELPCWHKDGVCTNPHRDCINCPRTNFTDMQQFYTTCSACTSKMHLNDNLNENVE